MEEGSIYEEGTPEEIFEHPKKPKTIAFIKKIQMAEMDITDKTFDFTELAALVSELRTRNKSQSAGWNHAQLVLEEMLYHVLFPNLDEPFRLHLTVESDKTDVRICMEYDGKRFDPTAVLQKRSANSPDLSDEEIALKIIKAYIRDMTYSFNENESQKNHVSLTIK